MKRFPVVLLLLGLMVCTSHAAVVHLKDGSIVRGTIVSATARDIQFHTQDGMLTISNDRIERIDYSDTDAPLPPRVPAAPSIDVPPQRLNLYDPSSKRQYVSFGMGVSIPFGRVDFQSAGGGRDDNGEGSILLGGQYLYQVSPRWAAGLNLDYMHRGRTGSQSLLPSSTTDVFGDSLVFLPVAKFSLATEGMVRPYLLGGVGLNRTSTLIEAAPNPGFEWSDTNTFETRTLMDDAHWGFASTLRAGLDFYRPFDPAVFGFEVGWTHVANPSYDATLQGQDLGLESVTGTLDFLTIGFRLGWRF
jgi:opacity protein-like surface antigen